MKTKFSKKQSVYWDGYTSNIDKLDLTNDTIAEKAELSFLLDILGNCNNKNILDLGCGTGKFGLKLSKYFKSVVGIDISKNSIVIANRTAKFYKIKNFVGIVGDFKDQGYRETFDIILAVNLIHHADNLDIILKHAKLALKKGGKLVIFEMNSLNILFIPFLIYHGQIESHISWQYLRSNIFSLKYVLRNAGYKIEKCFKWAWLPTSLYNRFLYFKKINEVLNRTPILNAFTAFNIIVCSPD